MSNDKTHKTKRSYECYFCGDRVNEWVWEFTIMDRFEAGDVRCCLSRKCRAEAADIRNQFRN